MIEKCPPRPFRGPTGSGFVMWKITGKAEPGINYVPWCAFGIEPVWFADYECSDGVGGRAAWVGGDISGWVWDYYCKNYWSHGPRTTKLPES